MPGLSTARVASAPATRNTARISGRMGSWETRLAGRNFVPLPIVFLPIVKGLAVDFVNRGLGDFHFTRLASQKEINVISFSVCAFHVHTSKVFASAEVGKTIVVHFCQVERQILTFIFDVKFSIRAFFAFRIDIFLDASGDISRADLFCLRALFRVLRALLWMFRSLFRVLRMLLRKHKRCRRKGQCNHCCDNKSWDHMNSFVLASSCRKCLDVLIEFYASAPGKNKRRSYLYLLTRGMRETLYSIGPKIFGEASHA